MCTNTLLVDGDERWKGCRLSREDVRAGIAVLQESLECCGHVLTRSRAAQPQLRVDAMQPVRARIVLRNECSIALGPEANIGFIPGLEEPSSDLVLAVQIDDVFG